MSEPSKKHPAIRALLDELAGRSTERVIRSNTCVPSPIGCGGPADTFRDALSRREYSISGLCQACQDKIFGGE